MRQVKKGSTNVSVDVYIIDSTDGTPETGVVFNTSGIDMEYRREGNFAVNITEADLATPDLEDVHLDGGFLHIGHGLYRLDVPDLAFVTGAETVSIQGTVTGMIVLPQTIQLVDFDPEDGVRLGLTALPNAAADAAGGLAISDAGALDLDAKLANTNEVTAARMAALTDWIDGGRLDLLLDAIPTTAMRGTDSALTDKDGFTLSTAGILAIWHQAVSAIVTADSIGKLLVDEITSARMATLTDWIDGGRLDLLLDAIPTTAMRGTDSALTDKAGFSLSTAGILAIWHQALSAVVTASSVGKLLKDEITSVRMAILTDWIDGGRLDLLLDLIKVATDNLPVTPKKNVALTNVPFKMVDETDHVTPETGRTITGTISQDGGAFAALTNAEAEIANGWYKVDVTQTEMNADVIILKFTAPGADQTEVVILTDA